MTQVQPLILAAGKGTRMNSDLPKVLLEIAGKPMLRHVLDAAAGLSSNSVPIVVTGFGSNQIHSEFTDCKFVEQNEQLGTGHAVQIAADNFHDNSMVLVLYGDVPLIQTATLQAVIDASTETGFGLLTVQLSNASGYGRVVRDENDKVTSIVEHKDASPEELAIKEVNTGILAASAANLKRWVSQLSNDNAQGEYYLTDIIAMAVAEGLTIQTANPTGETEVMGANDRIQLAVLERAFQLHLAEELISNGATIMDPNRIDIRGSLSIGTGVKIDINSVFEGEVTLGNNVVIEPNCVIHNTTIGEESTIKAFTHIEGAAIGPHVSVGPYARLREGSKLANGSKVGNFVETKNTELGEGSKINHLSYAGDSVIGKNTNIGAGTITCNYDGVNKHKTKIGDNVFVGSNTAIVAPVKLADGSTVGAGSTITKDVERDSLSLTRSKQSQIKDWKRPTKK